MLRIEAEACFGQLVLADRHRTMLPTLSWELTSMKNIDELPQQEKLICVWLLKPSTPMSVKRLSTVQLEELSRAGGLHF